MIFVLNERAVRVSDIWRNMGGEIANFFVTLQPIAAKGDETKGTPRLDERGAPLGTPRLDERGGSFGAAANG